MNVGVGINSTLKQWRAEARVVSVGGGVMSEVEEQHTLERLSENGKKTKAFGVSR